MALTSRARRDRGPHYSRNSELQVSAWRRSCGCFCFDGERDKYSVAGVHVMDSGTRRSVASGTSGENNTRCSGYAVALGMRQIDLVAALGISEIAHLAM